MVADVIAALARIRDQPLADVAASTATNALRVFAAAGAWRATPPTTSSP